MDVDNLLTVTLIIRDRPFYTFRWIYHANTTKFPFKILIADGGKDQSVEENLRNKANHPNLNYEYLRFPYDESIKQYLRKISDALYQVKTPYVILADDDDFWNVEGLRTSIQFLEENPDYATCRGRNFLFIQNKKNVLNTKFNPHHIFDITHNSASERVMSVYKKCAWTFYDVHRTTQYQEIFKKVASIQIHFLPMVETMVSLMSAAQGKTKQLDIPYLIREDGHGQSTSRDNDHLTRLLTGPCAENLNAIHVAIAEEVSKQETIQKDVFVSQLRIAFQNFLVPALLHHLYAFYDIPFQEVVRNLKTWLIYFFERKYRKLGKWFRYFSKWLYQRKVARAFKKCAYKNKNPQPVFQNINFFLRDYHKKT